MSDEVARAVGAASPTPVVINGKECIPRPLGIRELTEVERDCLTKYKRQYLETYQKNLDLLPESDRSNTIQNKFDEVGRWDIDDLPPKYAYDSSAIKVSDTLTEWIKKYWSLEGDMPTLRICRLTAASLDLGALTEQEYQTMTGVKPAKFKVPYVNWWITGCYDGMVALVWACFRQYDVTRDQVLDSLGNRLSLLSELAREIDRLSAPSAGNG